MPSSRRRFSRAQLEHQLEILTAAVAAPLLPPTLPLSPPASRSASPAAPPKRKLPSDAAVSTEHPKRPRTSLHPQGRDEQQQPLASTSTTASASPHIATPPPSLPPAPPLAQVASLPPPPPPAALATAPTPGGPEPASFPHRRGKPTAADFTRLHERYSLHGKLLKYSAEVRNQPALFPQDHRRPGPAPAPGSPYAVHAQLFARLEAVDALLNFTYAMWCKDMVENKCHHALWDTIDQFLKWVRSRWETAETRGEAQRAFIGIIRMVEAYIYARKAAFLNTANAKRFGEVDKMMVGKPEHPTSASISPATSLGGSSQHSAPNASPPTNPTTSANVSTLAAPPPAPSAPATVAIPKDLYDSLHASHNCNARSARAASAAALYLTLPVLARCFPRTAARVQAGQLRPDEEAEVDFEQDECGRADGAADLGLGPGPGEGQLLWPGPLNAHGGEGVGWVCLLGRAMVRELGYPLGYRCLEGIVRKEGR